MIIISAPDIFLDKEWAINIKILHYLLNPRVLVHCQGSNAYYYDVAMVTDMYNVSFNVVEIEADIFFNMIYISLRSISACCIFKLILTLKSD